MVVGGIIGGLVGLLMVLYIYYSKEQRFKSVMKSVGQPVDYAALYHYATANRYKKSFKFFDSYGALYLIGKKLFYKTNAIISPMIFNLEESKVQQEENWRKLKWFSITSPNGEKHYFDSHKMGAFVNNSDETLKGLAAIKGKMSS